MPEQWRRCTLGEFVELKRGYDLPTADRRAGTVPIISSSGPSGWHDEARVKAPGVVTGRYGTIGDVFFVEHDFWPLNTTLYVRDFKGNDERFVSYFLRSLDFHSFNDKSSVPGVNRNDLHRAPVLIPALDEQREIAGILGSLDDKIDQSRQMAHALEEFARATFNAWFVDFEPVKAKAAGATSFPGMPSAAFAALPDRLTDSPVGPVPEDWTVRRLADLMTLHYGKSLTKSVRQPGNVPVFGSGGVDGTHDEALVQGPGIVVGRKGSVGTVYWTDVAFFPIDTTYYVESKGHLSLPYLYELLGTLGLEAMNTDAAVPGLNRENAYRLETVVPSPAVVRGFDDLIGPFRTVLRHLSVESSKLATLRDYLLPRLLSGRVRVRMADAQTTP